MALSDQLEDLAGRTKKLEETAATVRAKNVAKLEQQREQIKAKVDAEREKAREKTTEAKADAQQWWAGVKSDMEKRRAEAKAKFEQHKAERAEKNAEFDADAAEDYASTVATIAGYALDEAVYAALDATVLREKANAMNAELIKG